MPGLNSLRMLREAAGLTQQDLAKLTGLTTATISYAETGRVDPSLDTIKRLAEALGVQPGALLDEPATPAEGAA